MFAGEMSVQDSFFLIKPNYNFSDSTETVITAFQVKAHVNNKLHSRVPSLLVVTSRRLIIYRTATINAYWLQLILSSSVGLIPFVGFIVSYLVEKLVDGCIMIYRTLTRSTDKSRKILATSTAHDLLINKHKWPILFQKDLTVLARELKCVRVRSSWPKVILLDTKSNLKSFRYPYIKCLFDTHIAFLAVELKLNKEQLSSWFNIEIKDDEITLTPQF
ncbi:MAG: hypothetical protein KF856_09575 [Cyclobacteriaceae bacterium]|nr:hypothetical protein [Cyclobacteriaceae bacterium]